MKELTDFEIYKLLDTLNLLEATCLIIGASPDQIGDASDSTNDYDWHNRYYLNSNSHISSKHFRLVLNALIRGVELQKIQASKQTFYATNDDRKIIDPAATYIDKGILVNWLKTKGVYPEALFPLEPDNELLNQNHPYYAPKLALIVESWQQLKYAELNNQTVKKYLEDWIRDNSCRYGFESMGENMISNLAEIVNFDKGGRRITGSPMEHFDTIEKQRARLEIKQKNNTDVNVKEDPFDLPF